MARIDLVFVPSPYALFPRSVTRVLAEGVEEPLLLLQDVRTLSIASDNSYTEALRHAEPKAGCRIVSKGERELLVAMGALSSQATSAKLGECARSPCWLAH